MRDKWLAMFFLVILMSVPSSCRDHRNQDDEASCQPTESFPAGAATSGSGAVIVTDISGSMKGFALPGSTQLFTLHDALERAVRNALADVEPAPVIQRCYIGTQLDCASRYPIQAMDNPATYSSAESRLYLFFTPGQQEEAGMSKVPEDPIGPYRLAILLTDGMQAHVPGKTPQGPCLAGADPACLTYLLRQRVEKGYGVWMALFYLPFRGIHFAERPLDAHHWQQIRQHIAQLDQDPYFQGVSFKVARSQPAMPFTSYHFEGVKPLLLLVLSRDLRVGRKFIEQFASQQIAHPRQALFTIELAPLSVRPRQIAKISLVPSASPIGVRPVVGSRKENFYDYLVECDREGAATFRLEWREGEGIQMLPEGVQVNFGFEPVGKKLPEGTVVFVDRKSNYEVQLSCRMIRPGKYNAWFKFQAILAMDVNAHPFWKALHFENSYEAPERLFGLRDLVQGSLEIALQRPRITDCLRLRIERK
ncbi:MAG: hypothetical protein QXE50_07700 [Nitrososphaerota archaeon]